MPEIPSQAEALFTPRYESAKRYVDILASRGIDYGLIGPREADRLWTRHVINSVLVSRLIKPGLSVLDVGSGAGLPGIPLAIARPDLDITLMEPLLRRYDFLCAVVNELELGDQVTVIRGRAEDLPGKYDVVTARAVASLDKLLKWTKDHFLPDGELLALKGSSSVDEVSTSKQLLKNLGLKAWVHELSWDAAEDPTYVVEVHA